MNRPPLPPFAAETAAQKARLAEDAWNTRDPAKVALAYSVDSVWRNRAEFIRGREAIEAFLIRKWIRELEYRLIKEVWAFRDNRIAVRFAYEWHDNQRRTRIMSILHTFPDPAYIRQFGAVGAPASNHAPNDSP